MVVFLRGHQGSAAICNEVILPICLFWESTAPIPSLDASVEIEILWYNWQRPGWGCSCMPVSGHQRLSRHPLVVTPFMISYRCLLLQGAHSVVVGSTQIPLRTANSGPQGQERLEFCVYLGWCTFSDASQVQIARPHTFLADSVHQIINLFLKKTAL